MTNKLRINQHYIEIECDRNDMESKLLAGAIPYVHKNRTNTIFKTTIRNIDMVLEKFRGITAENIAQAPFAVRMHFDKEMQRRIITKSLIELGPDKEDKFLWRHQQLGRELSVVNDRFAFFYDTRTGKTPMSLQIIYDDIRKNPHHKWLVLCPLILIENAWLQDARDMFPDLKVINLHGKTRAERLTKFAQKGNLYLSNIESFPSYREEIDKLKFHGCFVDESSAMKSNSSKFANEAVDFAYNLKRWYLLSGTPAPNGEWEYYRQLQSVDYYSVHQSWSQFKDYFFENLSRNPQYPKLSVRPNRKEELMGLLREYSLYVDKEDVLTTPGRDFNIVELTMPKELKEKYEELRKQMYLDLGTDISVTSPSTAATLNKLNQVSSGFIIDTQAIKYNNMLRANQDIHDISQKEVYSLSEYRFDKLEELLQTMPGKQAIIWANYHEEFRIIKERLGDRCALVYGGTNITEKNINIANFKAGKVQYMVANPKSADKGLTLTNAHVAIYFSLGYSYELWKQSIERIYGDIKKQPERCQYYIFIAKDTVDRTIYNAVQNKGDMSGEVLAHLKGGV